MSNKNASPARGTKDILPREAQLRSWAISKIVESYTRHGFTQIETPILENIDWLTGGVGGENEKLLFKILKRGEKLDLLNVTNEDDLCDLALRFDLTVPLTRYYANNQARLPQPFKAIQIGPVFRAERPQKGRLRQFIQCDIDILGEPSFLGEIELIAASADALLGLEMRGFEIKVNDRRALEVFAKHCGVNESQSPSFFITLDKLDKIGIQGVAQELGKNSFSAGTVEKLTFALEELKSGRDPLAFYSAVGVADQVVSDMERIVNFANQTGQGRYQSSIDPTVIRGMGYYTGTVFEVSYPGWSSSIAGGGRYDTMLARYGHDSPAVGFSLGFERILSILLEHNEVSRGDSKRCLTILFDESENLDEVFAVANAWRDHGYFVSLRIKRAKVGQQLKRLESEAAAMRNPGDFYGFMIYNRDTEPVEL